MYIIYFFSLSNFYIDRGMNMDNTRRKSWKNNDSNIVVGSLVKDIPDEMKNQRRSGVIVYTLETINQEVNNIVFFAGIDTKSGEITDFGGQKEPKDRNSICTGLREFTEESIGVFGKIDESEIQNSYAIYSSNMMIIFIYMDINVTLVNSTFDSLRIKKGQNKNPVNSKTPKQISYLEVKRLSLMSFDEMKRNICNSQSNMYSVVRTFLRRFIVELGKSQQDLHERNISPNKSNLDVIRFDSEFEKFKQLLLE